MQIFFTELLAKVANLSKQNQKSDPESELRRRQTNTSNNKENVRSTTNDYTKEQLEAVKRYKILLFSPTVFVYNIQI